LILIQQMYSIFFFNTHLFTAITIYYTIIYTFPNALDKHLLGRWKTGQTPGNVPSFTEKARAEPLHRGGVRGDRRRHLPTGPGSRRGVPNAP
jgi:hypothetical protein